MKYHAIIESDTLVGLIQKMKEELEIITNDEEQAKKVDEMSKTKVYKKKPWTNWDIKSPWQKHCHYLL